MTRRAIFAAIRDALGRGLTQAEVDQIDALLDSLGLPLDVVQSTHTLRDPAAFFVDVRKVTGSLDQVQVDSINRFLAGASHWPIGWLAYGLATAWHESRLKPVSEIGKGAGKPYGKHGKYGQAQYGRGFVQLTWDKNYEWADKALGLGGALLKNFNLALDPDIAARILIAGMETGAFTGKSLADYITGRGDKVQFVNARRTVNGTDRADLIAGYAVQFLKALDAGCWE